MVSFGFNQPNPRKLLTPHPPHPLPTLARSLRFAGTTFTTTDRFEVGNIIGKGAYGTVCAATDLELSRKVAIKKISGVNINATYTKRTLRELRIMRLIGKHDNVLTMRQIIQPSESDNSTSSGIPDDLYLVLDFMETDLSNVIKSKQHLSSEHIQFFIYQVLRGLLFLHSHDIIHRDLKPRNLLVNADCGLRICDFGLARYAPDRVDSAPVPKERRDSEDGGSMTRFAASVRGGDSKAVCSSETERSDLPDCEDMFAHGMDSLHFEESKPVARNLSSSSSGTRQLGSSAAESKEEGKNTGGDLPYAGEEKGASASTANRVETAIAGDLTDYVASRWYRAPEIIVGLDGNYTKAVDIWGVGCILGEMIMRKPLFPGENSEDQINIICDMVAMPDRAALFRVTKSEFRRQLMSISLAKNRGSGPAPAPRLPGLVDSKGYSGLAMDMLDRCLSFDPKNRQNVELLIGHPFIERWHKDNDEPVGRSLPKEDFAFDIGRERRSSQFCAELQSEIAASMEKEARRAGRRSSRQVQEQSETKNGRE